MSFHSVRVRRAGERAVRFLFLKPDRSTLNLLKRRSRRSSSSSSSTSSPPHDAQVNADSDEPEAQSKVAPYLVFVANLQPDVTADDLASGFAAAGRVASLSLSALQPSENGRAGETPVRVAHVGFLKRSEYERAMALKAIELPGATDDIDTAADESRTHWHRCYLRTRPTIEALEARINEFMSAYDAAREAAAAARLAALGSTDADGWTTVARAASGKPRVNAQDAFRTKVSLAPAVRSGEDGGAGALGGRMGKGRSRKRRGAQPELGFYRFQREQARRNELADARRRYGAARQQVAGMPAAAFRPE